VEKNKKISIKHTQKKQKQYKQLFFHNINKYFRTEKVSSIAKTHLGLLFFGSSLSLAKPPNKYTLFPISVKLCPRRGHGGEPCFGGLGFNLFHSQRLA
jgi:hypothetical protein